MKNLNLNSQNQQGFTLIELMISITLGLLVIAIASQVYLTSYNTNTVQKSSGDITASSIFGIQQLESHIRLANMGNNITRINEKTPKGGIVLSQKNVKNIGNDYLTKGGSFSDRLTIQFRNITGKTITDCEGKNIANGGRVIESYFLADGDLKCDASQNGIANLGKGAQTIIPDVEAFGLRIGAQDATGTAYMKTDDYKALKDKTDTNGNITALKPVITSIKMGLLLRGDKPITGATRENFTLLGQDVNKTSVPSVQEKYVRNVYESTSYLRNARLN